WAKVPWGLITYVSLMFTLASIGFAGNATFNQRVFIDDRDSHGGPNGFTAAHYSTWVNMMAFVVMFWFGLALIPWLWFGFTCAHGAHVLQLRRAPSLLFFFTDIARSLLPHLPLLRHHPHLPALGLLSRNFGIVYWSLSLSLSLLLSFSIATRILLIRRSITRAIGPQHLQQYVSIVVMLVESAVIYAVWDVFFLICFARNAALQNILVGMLGQVQGIAPILIVFRVAQGRPWSQYTLLALRSAPATASPSGVQSPFGDGMYSDGGSFLRSLPSEKNDAGSFLQSEAGRRSETGSLREGWGRSGGLREEWARARMRVWGD
ncbi:hypothetical protein C8R44DRAFT_651269, partial [Mycena epipterygia]